jgi:NDP-sugar pyrophosphorylase family protein
MNKQLVIPMSGEGARFVSAGYKDPKPLIKIFNKQMIQYIIEMYPGWDNVLFIVNSKHFNDPNLNLEQELIKIVPTAKISVIAQHKYGPSFAVLKSIDYLIDNGPIVVNYSDFAGKFDLVEFEKKIFEFDCNLLTYTGFHPHMLRNSMYAYLLEENKTYTDIQEKKSYTHNPMSEEASAGAYSFKSKELLVRAIKEQINNDINFQGEFYTSLTVKCILQSGGVISTTKMSKFYQWGTPEDLNDYIYWKTAINEIDTEVYVSLPSTPNNVIALMAGLGSRLKTISKNPKPLIPILDKPLWEHSLRSKNQDSICLLIVRSDIQSLVDKSIFDKSKVLNENTRGQAESAFLALSMVNNLYPISFLSTDCILPTNFVSFVLQNMEKHDLDLVVWTSKDYPPALQNSNNYSYVDGEILVNSVHLKVMPKNSKNDLEMITGNFSFRNKEVCSNILDELMKDEKNLINEEFYLDSAIRIALKQGYRVGKANVPNFIAIGTTEEFQTYEYWKS